MFREISALPRLSLSVRSCCPDMGVSGKCRIERCDYATKIKESIHLIRLGARAGLVSQVTQLEKATVKRLYQEVWKKPSPPGQMPFSDAWYRDDDRRMLQATLVWRLHQRLSRTGRRPARLLIHLFEAYSLLARKPLLDITRVAIVPQLVAMGTCQERLCEYCNVSYLAPVDSQSIAFDRLELDAWVEQ